MIRKLGAAGAAAARAGMVSSGLAMVAEMQRRTAEEQIFDRGGYRRAWQSSSIPNGVRIFNNATYAGVIEDGRHPGARPPPAKVMEDWAKRKLGLNDIDAKEASFALARSIGKKGLRGKHVLELAVPALTLIVLKEVRSFLSAAARGTSGGGD